MSEVGRKMGPNEWKKMEATLIHLGHPVRLECDGYRVSFVLERLNQFQNRILFYVDGVFKSQWFSDDCEERRRFFDRKDSFVWNRKSRANLNNEVSKSILKEAGIDVDKKRTHYVPWWVSFKRLRKHLMANNQDIRLISPAISQPVKGECGAMETGTSIQEMIASIKNPAVRI